MKIKSALIPREISALKVYQWTETGGVGNSEYEPSRQRNCVSYYMLGLSAPILRALCGFQCLENSDLVQPKDAGSEAHEESWIEANASLLQFGRLWLEPNPIIVNIVSASDVIKGGNSGFLVGDRAEVGDRRAQNPS